MINDNASNDASSISACMVYTRSANSIIHQRATYLQEFSFSTTQNMINVGTIKHGPAQVYHIEVYVFAGCSHAFA